MLVRKRRTKIGVDQDLTTLVSISDNAIPNTWETLGYPFLQKPLVLV
jgi:hypothetical protein